MIASIEDAPLENLNKEWFLLRESGHVSVATFEKQNGRRTLTRYGVSDFKKLYEPQRHGRSSLAEAWLSWEGRRQYNSVVFAPPCDCREPGGHCRHWPEGALNLWDGYG